MKLQTISWSRNKVKIIDQTKLPLKLEYLNLGDLKSLWGAIKILKVRGAPALGVAAALGVYLGVKNSKADSFRDFFGQLNKAVSYLASARPTARNLFYGLERMKSRAFANKNKPLAQIKKLLLKEALAMMEEDKVSCRRIGRCGAGLFRNQDAVLTICNAGALATVDYGTALGVIYAAKSQGKRLKVFVSETRPLLQGSRLSAWELRQRGIDVTLICDNMAAALMQQGKISKVITGADRIASNGDSANKIGTYNLAVLARYHKIPFYIAAPTSTFDLKMKNGSGIIIEERPQDEITEKFFKQRMAARGVKVFNPAFDVTPHRLISAIITDRGIIRQPYQANIRKLIKPELC